MGKRPEEIELFEGDMGSIQRENRSSMQREEKPIMETGLEPIAAKARSEPKLRFTSLAYHITKERVWTNLLSDSETLGSGSGRPDRDGSEGELQGMGGAHASVRSPQGIPGADIRRVYIPKPGKTGKAPLGRSLCQRPGAPA